MIAGGPSEGEIIDRGLALLRELLPSTWHVRPELEAQGNEGADVVLDIAGPQGTARTVVEVKRSFSPRDVGPVARQAQLLRRIAGSVPILVVAPWLSERSRALLTEAGVNYVDLTGNVRFTSDYPAIFIDRLSNAPAPRRPQSTPSLRGAKAGRVASLLTDVQPPYGVIELANHAGVTPGYVSRLLEELHREDLVERTRQGRVVLVRWRELLERRAVSYGVFTSNRIERFVCPNGPAHALALATDPQLQDEGLALSGSFAAEQIVAVAAPALLLVYARSRPETLIEHAHLLPAETGANVVIATNDDATAMESRWPVAPAPASPVPLVAASRIVLDCLTGNGRMPQEGQALLEWMGEDEGRWRLPSLAALPPRDATA